MNYITKYLKKNGYSPIKIIGRLYLVRYLPKDYEGKYSVWKHLFVLRIIPKNVIITSNKIVHPKGKLRID